MVEPKKRDPKRMILISARKWIAAGASAFALALTPPPLAAAQQPASAPLHIDVHANEVGPRIEPDIFGQFAEHLGTGIYGGIWVGPNSPISNVRGIRTDVVQALRALKVPNVRWPGGCFADEYHWREGIGPNRPERVNTSWGGVLEPNTFGTHEFFDFLDQIGSEAYLSVNVGFGTVREAADWMEYLTADKPTALAKERAANGHPSPYKIKYLGLGNENWGCGGSMSADHYVEEMKQYAHYSRNLNSAQTGTTAMKRIAVGWDSGTDDYTETVMKAWKAHNWAWNIEGVSLHGYTIPGSWEKKGPSVGFGEDEYAKGIRSTLKMKEWVAKQSAIMDRYDPEKKLGLYVDEWGIWVDPNPGSNPGFLQQQNTVRDAVIAALNLDIFMRNADRVRGANIAQMVNVLQAMILTDGPKMLLTPTYHIYRMYVPFQGANIVPVSFDAGSTSLGEISLPRIDALAARDRSGKVWLSLINVDPNRPTRITASIPGARSATGQVLTGAAVDSHNSFDQPNAVTPKPFRGVAAKGQLVFDLPPKSVVVVQLQ
jgi:alpha-N-arabinofuranosidase